MQNQLPILASQTLFSHPWFSLFAVASHFAIPNKWFVSPSSSPSPGEEWRSTLVGVGDRSLSGVVQPLDEQVSSDAAVLNAHVKIAG